LRKKKVEVVGYTIRKLKLLENISCFIYLFLSCLLLLYSRKSKVKNKKQETKKKGKKRGESFKKVRSTKSI